MHYAGAYCGTVTQGSLRENVELAARIGIAASNDLRLARLRLRDGLLEHLDAGNKRG